MPRDSQLPSYLVYLFCAVTAVTAVTAQIVIAVLELGLIYAGIKLLPPELGSRGFPYGFPLGLGPPKRRQNFCMSTNVSLGVSEFNFFNQTELTESYICSSMHTHAAMASSKHCLAILGRLHKVLQVLQLFATGSSVVALDDLGCFVSPNCDSSSTSGVSQMYLSRSWEPNSRIA